MRYAMVSPQTPTVGCGVFAVRAKISPPVVTMRRCGVCSDVACRVGYKNRGFLWVARNALGGGGNGDIWIAMRHAMVSSQTLTVGCGVFAVRAKISPLVVTMRRCGVCSDAACRVGYKNRGFLWVARNALGGGGNGDIWIAMRHAMVSSQTLTVGCGVFAVRAKISPPVVTMRRCGVCSDVACRVAILSILPVAAFIFSISPFLSKCLPLQEIRQCCVNSHRKAKWPQE